MLKQKTIKMKVRLNPFKKLFTLNKVFFISTSFEERSSLYFQRQCSWSTENVHPGFMNLCYYSDPRKKLWLLWPSAIRQQIDTFPKRAEKPSLHVTVYPGLVPGIRLTLAPAQRQVGSTTKAWLTQHPDLCPLQVCGCPFLLLSSCSSTCMR